MHTRRRFLKGIATTLALPMCESLAIAQSKAADYPTRLAFVYIPNGVNVNRWVPTPNGESYTLSDSLQPLSGLEKHISVLRHLDLKKAEPNGDGPGDHARANATFLTGCQARKTSGADIQIGVSVDQLAARKIGHLTRVPSLELSTGAPRRSGQCDSGYSCAYMHNLSWINESTPAPPERDPRLVFEKLFGSGNPQEDARRRAYRKSILDFVMDDARRLHSRLGSTDRGKMDEYLSSVRDIEVRIQQAEKFKVTVPEAQRPDGIPTSYQEHIRIQFELMALAFQSDTSRISTFMLAHDGSDRPFPELNIQSGHHQLSHHRNSEESLNSLASIDRFYAEQFAWFLERLRQTQEGESNLLERSMIVYGSGILDGNRHDHTNLPVLLAGHGNGKLNPGRFIDSPAGTPMTNLYISLLDRIGVDAERIGDSNGSMETI